MLKHLLLYFSLSFGLVSALAAQTRAVQGLHNNTPAVFALTNATVVIKPGQTLVDATLLIRNGIIQDVGQNISIPADAWRIDMKGCYIYPGFIDLWIESGFPAGQASSPARGRPGGAEDMGTASPRPGSQSPSLSGAVHWNPQIRSWYDAAAHFRYDEKTASLLRSQGILMGQNIPPLGIFRGHTALISLGDGAESELLIRNQVAQALSFNRSTELGTGYPTSLMGVIALMRQTWYDAQWYAQAQQSWQKNPRGISRPEQNLALEALQLASADRKPVIFETEDELAILRALAITQEFQLNTWIMGNGFEYRRLEALRNLKTPLILPLDFPATPDIEQPEKAMNISLEELRHWDYAPENPALLHNAGIRFAISSRGMHNPGDFLKNIQRAVHRGLPAEVALQALTLTPAQWLGIEHMAGSLEPGKIANFIVTDGDLFASNSLINEVWIDGKPYPINTSQNKLIAGRWTGKLNENHAFSLDIKENNNRWSGNIQFESRKINLNKINYDGHRLTLSFPGDSLGASGMVTLSASIYTNKIHGIGYWPDGTFINWQAQKQVATNLKTQEEQEVLPVNNALGPMRYPSMEFGYTTTPEQPQHLLIRNATIWTQGPQGRMEGADMLVHKGKVVRIGHQLQAPQGAMIIEAHGRHLTPGLVDPHLHTSIPGGVNEVGNAIVAETRITDVISGDNIWVYRLLAGGLTSANLLHGSANPIGGQDAVIKMRWGALPHELLLHEASPGLKLALGENVKGNTSRYPNTRMGTEQSIRDAFQAALDYQSHMQAWKKNTKGIPPRKNLQLEAILEVLQGKRIVHAHAYRQDEIQMLIRLAEEFGFKITSFEHTVEGYKVADIMAAHGAGAIVWTDWSSFKMEAYDGNIYNAALLLKQGVLTSLHSDNTQLATRMNWEAGKVLATGIDEITAMDLITINAAKMLGADHVIGSLEPGKHADFVIWNTHPLSGFSHAEETWIEGRKYFDRQKDQLLRQEVVSERAILIQKILDHKTRQSAAVRPGPTSTPNSTENAF